MKRGAVLPFIEASITWLVILFPLLIVSGKALSEVGMIMITLLFVGYLFIMRDFKFLREKWVIASGVFWLYLVIRSLFGPDIKHALVKSLPFVRFIIFAVCCETLVSKDKEANKRIFIALSIALAFLIFDGFIQFFNGRDLFGRLGGNRLTGPFSQPILGTVVASFGIMAIAGLVGSKKLILLLASFLIFAIVFLSGERGALMRFISSLVLLWLGLFLFTKDQKTKRNLWIAALLIVITCVISAAIAISLRPEIMHRQILSPIEQASAGQNSPYLFLWWTGIEAGLSNILFGIGLNQYEFFCQANPHPVQPWCGAHTLFIHPHNIWIELFAETGLVGVILLAFMIYILARKLIGFCKTKANILEFSLALGVGIAAFQRLLPLPSSGFFKNWYAITIWFAIGWMLCIMRANKSKSS